MSNATALAASAPSMASVPPLSMSGLAAFWVCFAIAGAASGLFGSMVMYKSHSAASKSYYYCSCFGCAVLACFYLFFATGFMPSQPYGVAFDYTGWKFLLWACKTPWLLAQLAALAGMPNTELGAMLFWDAVMLLAGFGAQAAATSEGVWPLFVVGCAAQAILFYMQYSYLEAWLGEAFNKARPESNIYPFVFWFSFLGWNAVTLVMVLDKLGALSYDAKASAYVVTELFTTVYFGLLTCGAREALEGEETVCSSFASLHFGSIEPLPGRGAPRGAPRGVEALPTSPATAGGQARKNFGGIKKTGFGTGTSTDHNEMLPPPPYSMVAHKQLPPRSPAPTPGTAAASAAAFAAASAASAAAVGAGSGAGAPAAAAMSTNDIARLMQAVQNNPALKQQLAAMQAMQLQAQAQAQAQQA